MTGRSYIGIDSTDKKEWIVILWTDGKIICSRPFKNTPTELDALVGFITERCSRPKICLRPEHPAALKLIKFIGGIPDVEVVLLSEAGLCLHRPWLSKSVAMPVSQARAYQAYLLAYCAQRMI